MTLFEPGAVVGGNEIVQLIGSGGFAEVYEAFDPSGALRALKVIKTLDPAKAVKIKARLAQEGEALATIEHPNVIRFHDAGVDGDNLWLLLELVRGHDLRQALRQQEEVPHLEAVVRWVRLACEGVAEAHRLGILHRDLKPENLLVAPSDVVKIIDFGLAKLHGWGVKTTQEKYLGSVLYMAPEYLRSAPADARTDVYSLGMVLYEAITGKHPCTARRTTIEIVNWHLAVTPPPIGVLLPDVPADLEALVEQAIEKDPRRRIQSARALADGLQEVLSRMLVPRRRVARNLPAFSKAMAHDVTAPMAVMAGEGACGAPVVVVVTAPVAPVAHGGTVVMAAVLVAAPSVADSGAHRDAVAPLAPTGLPSGAAAEVQAAPSARPVRMVQMPAEADPVDRRTTAAPVESAAVPRVPVRRGRRWVAVAVLGAAAAAILVGGSVYRLSGSGPAVQAGSPVPAIVPTASGSASAGRAPVPVATATAPSATGSAGRGARPVAPRRLGR